MEIELVRKNDAFHFEAINQKGNSVQIDGSESIGGENKGMSPMQLLLVGLGGCSAIDVAMILKKQKQEIKDFKIEVDGEREEIGQATKFKSMEVHFKLKGDIDPVKAERAAQLSLEKYCSVAMTFGKNVDITFKVSVNA